MVLDWRSEKGLLFLGSILRHKGKKRKWFIALESSDSSKFDYKSWYAVTDISYQRMERQFIVNL